MTSLFGPGHLCRGEVLGGLSRLIVGQPRGRAMPGPSGPKGGVPGSGCGVLGLWWIDRVVGPAPTAQCLVSRTWYRAGAPAFRLGMMPS
jgi:hypothetical protein